MRIALDSNCVTYVIDTMNSADEPSGSLAIEKLALFRSYLYLQDTFYVLPTVIKEYEKISNDKRRKLHCDFVSPLFHEVQIDNYHAVEQLAISYGNNHAGLNDCLILSEAKASNMDVLLTYDENFLKHLSPLISKVKVLRPSEFWVNTNIPHGAVPDKQPHKTNPLSNKSWWNW